MRTYQFIIFVLISLSAASKVADVITRPVFESQSLLANWFLCENYTGYEVYSVLYTNRSFDLELITQGPVPIVFYKSNINNFIVPAVPYNTSFSCNTYLQVLNNPVLPRSRCREYGYSLKTS